VVCALRGVGHAGFERVDAQGAGLGADWAGLDRGSDEHEVFLTNLHLAAFQMGGPGILGPPRQGIRLGKPASRHPIARAKRVSSRLIREKTRARLLPVPFHLGKVKSSTSALTRAL
jgi:hypothetical protein